MCRVETRNHPLGAEEREIMTDQSITTQVSHARHTFHFARHLLEMIVSMAIGMFVGGAIFLTAAGGLTPIQGMTRYPCSSCS